MRKFAFAIAAAALVLLAGALTAEAMTGSSTLSLRSTAKNFSPIDTVACRASGPVCGLGFAGRCGAAGAPVADGSFTSRRAGQCN
jgi:hypothetical protein